MANPVVLTDAVIWLGGYDLSGNSNEVNFTASRQENADSRLGDTIEAVYPGPLQVGAEVKGHWDSTLDGPLFTQLTSPTEAWPLTICPDGGDDGEVAYGLQAYNFNYSALEAQWGDLLPYRLSVRPKSGLGLGRGGVLYAKATHTISAVPPKVQLGAISATQKALVTRHVFAQVGGGSWATAIYSDADDVGGGENYRSQFSNSVAGPAWEMVEIAGPVTDTYWEVNLVKTGGTSITVAFTFLIVEA